MFTIRQSLQRAAGFLLLRIMKIMPEYVARISPVCYHNRYRLYIEFRDRAAGFHRQPATLTLTIIITDMPAMTHLLMLAEIVEQQHHE